MGISEVAFFQAVKVTVAKSQAAVPAASRGADVVRARDAMVRVYLAPEAGYVTTSLTARLTLTNGGVSKVLTTSGAIATASTEATLTSTLNFDVSGTDITADTSYRVALEQGVPCQGVSSAVQFPSVGATPLEAREVGTVKVRVIPIRYLADGSGRVPVTDATVQAKLKATIQQLYPTSAVDLDVGAVLDSSIALNGSSMSASVDEICNLQSQAGTKTRHYMGLVQPNTTFSAYCNGSCTTGTTRTPSTAAFSCGITSSFPDRLGDDTFAHELAHSHSIRHAPCGGAANSDPAYPMSDGTLDVWGYNGTTRKLVAPTGNYDFMSYCDPAWVSAFQYDKLAGILSTLNGVKPPPLALTPVVLSGYSTLMVDGSGQASWGGHVTSETPDGEAELATVRDAGGNAIIQLTVYRYPLSDTSEFHVLVPDPQPGWTSIEVQGAGAVPFR